MITVYIDSGPGRNLKGYTETNKPAVSYVSQGRASHLTVKNP